MQRQRPAGSTADHHEPATSLALRADRWWSAGMRRSIALAIGWAMCSAVGCETGYAARSTPTIQVDLPKDRAKCGTLTLRDSKGKVAAGPFTACGTADLISAKKHKNDSRSALLPYGHTPTGAYKVTDVFAVGEGTRYSAKSYGDFGAIRLSPQSGDAKLASEVGKRTGLLIHGGDLGAGGRLRPTNGCVRLSNTDMKTLIIAVEALKLTDGPAESCFVAENPSVKVTEPDESTGYDEGDPPPDGASIPIKLP